MQGILGRKRDPDLSFSFLPDADSQIFVAMAIFNRFCREVWTASLPADIRDPAVIPLGVIARGVGSMIAQRSKNPPRKVEGPLSALFKLLDKYGWSFHTPFVMNDKVGNKIHLLHQCPRRAAALFRTDVVATIQRRAAVRLHMKHGTPDTQALMDAGIFLAPLLRLCARLSKSEAFSLMLIVSNGLFTNTDLVDYGYDCDPTCTICSSSLDTVYHRCYTCTGTTNRARIACGSAFQQILDAGQCSMLGNRCLLPEPRMESGPDDLLQIEYINMQPDDKFRKQDGKIYGDGSCLYPNHKPLSRAGFVVVQVNSEGDVIRGIFGNVPSPLPQSTLAGEYSAFCTAVAHAEEGCVFVGDCQEVLSCCDAGFESMLYDVSFACIWRLLSLRSPYFRKYIVGVEKVKAHKTLAAVLEEGGCLTDYYGNYHADHYANLGARLHEPSAGDVRKYKSAMRVVQDVAEHMLDVLSVLKAQRQEARGKFPRIPAGVPSLATDNVKTQHQFAWNGKLWICKECLLRTRNPSLLSSSSRRCQGPPLFKGLLKDPGDHTLWTAAVNDGGVMLFCSVCFHHAAPHPRKLLEPCPGPVLAQSGEKYYLTRRKHPVSKLRLLHPVQVHA